MGFAAQTGATNPVLRHSGSSSCQPGSPGDTPSEVVAEPWAALFVLQFAPLALLTALALHLNFRRIRVRVLGPFPKRGSALVVSNHPCTWVDAGLLDLAFGRRLHFLTDDVLFQPRARAWFLRIYGSLPLSLREHDPEHQRLNATTFLRCEALFDLGAAVAMFPEGVSLADRGLLPLRPGAARLALQYRRRRDGPPLALIPASLHYSDRTAFQSEVTVTLGPALRLDDAIATDAAQLTSRIDAAIRAGIADLDHCGGVATTLEGLVSHAGPSASVETCQMLAGSLDAMARLAPEAHRQLLGRARAYSRALRSLRVGDRIFATGDRSRALSAAGVVTALALVPAVIGLTFHAVPLLLIRHAECHLSHEASHVALVRITSAAVWLPLWYAIVIFSAAWAGVPGWVLVSGLVATVTSGIVACRITYTASSWVERARLAWITRRHPRLVARARALRLSLQFDLDDLVAAGRT
jgi:glycerol-3-phosphate O-acyltransferase / dihydroxyacetone phosphate acyltransferase